MDSLFTSLPETLSPRLEWLEQQGFLTHYCPDMAPEEDPWIAIKPVEEDKGKDIGLIMSESCRLYDEEYGCGYGKTKMDAILDLCRKKSIPLWPGA
jgi:hypothetical protein